MDKLEKAKKERTKVSRTKKKQDKYAVSFLFFFFLSEASLHQLRFIFT